MILTATLSLLAGLLTVLAPCVLPFLPVIVGGSLGGQSKWRPYLVATSLIASLLVFTLLLKASTLLINVNPAVWTTVSGVLVILLGLVMLFPNVWATVSLKLGLERSHELLQKANQEQRKGWVSAVLTGFALGPVFSSCSPTYAWVVASVLPAEPVAGFIYLALYCTGVAVALLLISLLGRKLIERIKWAANPRGWFQRTIAILFIIVGLLVATGIDKKFQTWAATYAPGLTRFEEKILPAEAAPQGQSQQAVAAGQPDPADGHFNANYQAPEFKGLDTWINSEPQTLKDLSGKVVLVDFWTYSCINCIRTQPYLNDWYEKYHDQGFEIIGVHAPEFSFEKLPDNVRKAVQDAQIKYPVALDNNFQTWNAYRNRYWPAKYLIDQNGQVRYTHFGEGEYGETEENIRALLKVSGDNTKPQATGAAAAFQSPETYLGSTRAVGFHGKETYHNGEKDFHGDSTSLVENQWTLTGKWQVENEKITALSDGATLSYRFNGKEMYLVMSVAEGVSGQVQVKVANEQYAQAYGLDAPSGQVKISGAKLYRLVSLPQAEVGTLVTLTFSKGVSANAFTFGS